MLLGVAQVKSGRRRDKAELTRRRLIQAAHQEFLDNGFHGATMAAIARRAGVAGQTVYFVFHTKAELISAVIDAAVMGEDSPTVPQEADWWAAMHAAPDAHQVLRQFVRGAGPLLARAARISEVMRAAALTDPEVRTIFERHDHLQLTGYRQVVDLASSKGTLRPELTPEIATDLLLTLCGDSTYTQLTTDRRWTHDQAIEWLADAAPRLLLADREDSPSATDPRDPQGSAGR